MTNEAGLLSSSCTDVEGCEHLVPPACVAAWPLREALEALALSRVLCDPPPTSPSQGWSMEGAGRGEPGRVGHPQHLHHRSETCLQPWLDKYFLAKDTQGVTLSICSPLCSATGESLASLFQGAGWSLGMDTGALLGRSLGREHVFPSVRTAWLRVKVALLTRQLSRGSQYISLKMSFPSPGGLSPPAPEPQGWWESSSAHTFSYIPRPPWAPRGPANSQVKCPPLLIGSQTRHGRGVQNSAPFRPRPPTPTPSGASSSLGWRLPCPFPASPALSQPPPSPAIPSSQ